MHQVFLECRDYYGYEVNTRFDFYVHPRKIVHWCYVRRPRRSGGVAVLWTSSSDPKCTHLWISVEVLHIVWRCVNLNSRVYQTYVWIDFILLWSIICRSSYFQSKRNNQYQRNSSRPTRLFLENSTASGLSNEVLWGYIKSKMYVKNYENICDLKAAIIWTFQEVSDGMVTSTMENFGWRLEMVLRNMGCYFEKKVVMCLRVVYIRILMSVHFEHKLMKIRQIKLVSYSSFKSAHRKITPCILNIKCSNCDHEILTASVFKMNVPLHWTACINKTLKAFRTCLKRKKNHLTQS